MDDNVDKTRRLSPRSWRWLWVLAIIGCSVSIGSLLASDRSSWWDLLFAAAAIALGASALTARRVSGLLLILFAAAVTAQLIHELVTYFASR